MNMGQDRQMQMAGVQNLGIQNVENQNGLIVVPGIANPNLNKNRNGNVVAAQAEGNGNGNNGNIDEIEEVNANCILDENCKVHQAAETVTTSNELDLLFGPLFDEYFNGENQVVLKSSTVTTTDASNKRHQPNSTSSTSTLATTVTANGNFDLKRIFKKRSKKKAKNKQIQAREGKDQVKSKSKVIRMKKIQLEGLKLPSLKLYYKRLKRQGPKLPTGQRLQLSYKTSGDQTAYSPKKSSFPPNKP
ncbi:hypothetical protein Tco_1322598, partial [Tanacetum coccineum]